MFVVLAIVVACLVIPSTILLPSIMLSYRDQFDNKIVQLHGFHLHSMGWGCLGIGIFASVCLLVNIMGNLQSLDWSAINGSVAITLAIVSGIANIMCYQVSRKQLSIFVEESDGWWDETGGYEIAFSLRDVQEIYPECYAAVDRASFETEKEYYDALRLSVYREIAMHVPGYNEKCEICQWTTVALMPLVLLLFINYEVQMMLILTGGALFATGLFVYPIFSSVLLTQWPFEQVVRGSGIGNSTWSNLCMLSYATCGTLILMIVAANCCDSCMPTVLLFGSLISSAIFSIISFAKMLNDVEMSEFQRFLWDISVKMACFHYIEGCGAIAFLVYSLVSLFKPEIRVSYEWINGELWKVTSRG